MTHNNAHAPKRALRIKEFCRSYGLARSSVYKLHAQGKLPFVKVGRATLILIEHAEALLKNGCEAA